jgi:hypothetical protein
VLFSQIDIPRDLNITTFEDWYGVSVGQIEQRGGKGLLKHYNMSIAEGKN